MEGGRHETGATDVIPWAPAAESMGVYARKGRREWLEIGGGVISGLSNKRFRRWDAGGDHAMTITAPCAAASMSLARRFRWLP